MSDFDFQAAFEGVHERLDELSKQGTRNETKLQMLVGNGQPGKIKLMEDDIKAQQEHIAELTKWKAKAAGTVGASVFILGVLWKVADFLFQAYRGH